MPKGATLNVNVVTCGNSGAQGTRKLDSNNSMRNNTSNGVRADESASVQSGTGLHSLEEGVNFTKRCYGTLWCSSAPCHLAARCFLKLEAERGIKFIT